MEYRTDFGPLYLARNQNVTMMDMLPPDMAHLISPYWKNFPPIESKWNTILGYYTFFTMIVCCFGNALVLWIFGVTKSLRTPANLLVINLAFSDFCMMSLQSPVMIINFYFETWIIGPMWCNIYGANGSLFGNVSIWTMCMIALDRYNVIVKGVAGRPMTAGLAFFKILFIWFFGALWTFAPLFGWSRYVPEGNMTACTIEYITEEWNSLSYLLAYAFFVYYTPLFLICYSYWHIIKTVAAHERSMREQAKKMNVRSLRSSEDVQKSAEAKLARIALTTISVWFAAWTPYQIIAFSGAFQPEVLTPLTTIWGATLAKSASVLNPVIYAISHPKYRIALKDKCPCLVFGSVDEKTPNADAQTTNVAESAA